MCLLQPSRWWEMKHVVSRGIWYFMCMEGQTGGWPRLPDQSVRAALLLLAAALLLLAAALLAGLKWWKHRRGVGQCFFIYISHNMLTWETYMVSHMWQVRLKLSVAFHGWFRSHAAGKGIDLCDHQSLPVSLTTCTPCPKPASSCILVQIPSSLLGTSDELSLSEQDKNLPFFHHWLQSNHLDPRAAPMFPCTSAAVDHARGTTRNISRVGVWETCHFSRV